MEEGNLVLCPLSFLQTGSYVQALVQTGHQHVRHRSFRAALLLLGTYFLAVSLLAMSRLISKFGSVRPQSSLLAFHLMIVASIGDFYQGLLYNLEY